MSKQTWMCAEIRRWEAEGLVSPETAARLLPRYNGPSPLRKRLLAVLFGVIGAFCVGLGLIALVAANWADLGRGVRAALAMAPSVLCGLCACAAARKNAESAAFWEPVGVVWLLSFIAGASLVAQTYQLGGSLPGFVFFVALCILPLAWFVPSGILRILWLGFPLVWAVAYQTSLYRPEGGWGCILLGGALLTALSVPGYCLFLRRQAGAWGFIPGQIAAALAYSVGSATIAVLGLERMHILSSSETGVLPYVFCAAVVGLLGVRFKIPGWGQTGLLVGAIAASTWGFSPRPAFFGAAVAVESAILVAGICRLSLRTVNLGVILLLFVILGKFFMTDVSFTAKGCALLGCGIVLLAANAVLLRFIRQRRSA